MKVECVVGHQIPLYTHLRMASTVPVRRPPTPELVKNTRLKGKGGRRTHFDHQPPDQHE